MGHLNAKPPIFVPREHVPELETLSKAALLDLAWDFASSAGACAEDDAETLATFRERARLVLTYRGDRCKLGGG